MRTRAQRWVAAGRVLRARDPHRFDTVLSLAEGYVQIYRATDVSRRGLAMRVRRGMAAAIATLGVLALLVDTSPAAAERCGAERAPVKLGLDAEAGAVSMEPRDTAIADLVALRRPARANRRAPAELATWRIRVTIIAYKRERDGDYHVVVADDAGRHMIVEFPSPACAAAGAWAAQVAAAREALDRDLAGGHRPAAALRRVAIRDVVLVGVGFFDVVHGQEGVATNGIELHPVLSFEVQPGLTSGGRP